MIELAKSATGKKLKLTETAEGLSLDDPIDDCRARIVFGEKAKHGGKMGPAWRASFFHGLRHPDGLSLSLSDPDLDEIGKQLHVKTDDQGNEFLSCSKRKRHSSGRWQEADVDIRLGSTEITWTWPTLEDVPESGYVDLLIDAPDLPLTWAKQPPLTEDEIAEGAVRPENVINSFAVFTPYSGRILTPAGAEIANYQTGKICHVYRPKLVDANGATLWCDQSAPLGSPPRLRIWLPLEWLADAVFPVVLDPTFGYTSVGASTDVSYTGYLWATSPTSAASSGTLSEASVYCGAAAPSSVTVGLYSDSSSKPVTLIGCSAGAAGSVNSWSTQAVSGAISAGTVYWSGWQGQTASYWSVRYDAKAGGKTAVLTGITYSAGSLSNPFGTVSPFSNYVYSAYATYTESASGFPFPLLYQHVHGSPFCRR